MSSKAEKIGTVAFGPGMLRVRELNREPLMLELSRVLLFHEINSAFGPRLWVKFDEAKHSASASWETMSFVMLWLCGISAVGLAFL